MARSKAFREIAQGLKEAIEFAKGNTAGAKVREPSLTDIDVARLRRELDLSQSEFAKGFGISRRTLQDWEQGRRRPAGTARVLLNVIRKDPQSVARVVWPATLEKRRKGAGAGASPQRLT